MDYHLTLDWVDSAGFGEASMTHARETSDNRMNALYE